MPKEASMGAVILDRETDKVDGFSDIYKGEIPASAKSPIAMLEALVILAVLRSLIRNTPHKILNRILYLCRGRGIFPPQ